MSAIEVRKLNNSDLFRVLKMLKKVGAAGSNALTKMMQAEKPASAKDEKQEKPEEKQQTHIRIGFLILNTLLDNVVDDLQEWFASLLSKSMDEYLELAPETTLNVIEHLVISDDSKRFFSRALQLYNKMPGLAKE